MNDEIKEKLSSILDESLEKETAESLNEFLDENINKQKLNIGDRIRKPIVGDITGIKILDVLPDRYICEYGIHVPFDQLDQWELIEEQLSESLNEEIDRLNKRYPDVSFEKLSRIAVHISKWQKHQDEKEIDDFLKKGIVSAKGTAVQLAYEQGKSDMKQQDQKWLADNHKQIFNNGWAEGYEDGRDSMEEDMMKDAIEAEIVGIKKNILNGSYGYAEIPGDYKDGDKVKLIIFKEE